MPLSQVYASNRLSDGCWECLSYWCDSWTGRLPRRLNLLPCRIRLNWQCYQSRNAGWGSDDPQRGFLLPWASPQSWGKLHSLLWSSSDERRLFREKEERIRGCRSGRYGNGLPTTGWAWKGSYCIQNCLPFERNNIFLFGFFLKIIMDFFLFKSAISRRFCNQGFLAWDVLSKHYSAL